MRKNGILRKLVAACGAAALGVACLVAAPTPARAATYSTDDGITIEADTYTCEQGHRGTISSLELKDYSWNGNELKFKVKVLYQCPECNLEEQRGSEFHTVTMTCQGATTTFGHWHADSTDDSITFKFSVASGHHNLTHVAAVAATCENEGNIEYWECGDCHKLFLDAAGTQEASPNDVITPYAHEMHFVEGKLATCTEDGWIQHYACDKCGGTFLDDAGYCPWGVLRPKGHSLCGVDAKAATCTETGNIAYNECEFCRRKFADDACTHELTDDEVTIAPVAHTFENGVCTVCGAKDTSHQAQGNDPAGKPQGEKLANDPAGKLPAAKPTAKPATAKLGAAKLLPQTGDQAAPVAAVLALGAGVAALGVHRRRTNN